MNVTYQLRTGFVEIKGGAVAPSRARPQTPDMRPGFYRSHAKRMLDVTLVLLAALPILSVVALLALAILVTEGRNPFYLQDRIGMRGRVFRMWKLRTMVPDADRILDAYLDANPEARTEWDRTQKLRHDPRVTKLGDLMRRTSLDELPQLWNVLRGDMSLVGPRPMMVAQKDLYPGEEYYLMRPGITGYWQTSVRNLSSFSERATYDRKYHQDLSLRTDIGLLFKTVRVVATGTGC
jgi:lipopolysaccharide/colanic/teichoic acid biosynthesis glycosyltransferase